jgi:hypothetical protein
MLEARAVYRKIAKFPAWEIGMDAFMQSRALVQL